MRRSIRPSAALLIAWCIPASAVAQTATTTSDVALHQYQPTPFSDRMLRLDGSGVAPFGELRIGLDVDYAFRPLVLVDQTPGIFQAGAPGPDHNLIEHAVGGSLLASFGLGHRLELGAAVPLLLFQSGESVPGVPKPATFGLSNPLIGAKVHIGSWRGLGLGASVTASLPVGTGAMTHDTGFGGTGRLFADYRRGPLTFGLRGGLDLHAQRTFYSTDIGNQLDYAGGVSLRLGLRTTLMAEAAGLAAAKSPFKSYDQSPLEALGGLRQRIGKLYLTLAGGPGLIHGYGSPIFRAVAGLTWANRVPDADGDGVDDDNDLCPTVPEDRDGFEDGDGCPDPDNDKDGIPDAQDKCPNDAEDKDGFEDDDGCPDPDNDKDGIPDAQDKCPDQPETKNGFQDDDGCPDEVPPSADKDGDGIPDEDDECPEEAEDKDGFEDDDGCPDLDNDKDGIPDAQDKCPLEPETINGIDDDDGCPDSGPAQVHLGKTEIETLQPIFFDTDRSRVKHAFHSLLAQVALLLKAHPEIGRCAVEGHTDATGPNDWNQKLSVMRAQSVIEFLVNKGVDPKRLVPIGHGEELPWASNETPWGRARNRRVVFHIEGIDSDEKTHQREERRRRIRRRREAVPTDTEKAPHKAAPETKPAGSVKPEVKPEPPASAGANPPVPKSAAPAKPSAKDAVAKPAPNQRAPSASDGKTAPPPKPADDAKAPPSKPAVKPAPDEKPKSAKAPEPSPSATGDSDDPDGPAKPGSTKRTDRTKTPREPRRLPEDTGTDHPATLQELLKLPPR